MFDLISLLASSNYAVYNSEIAKKLSPNCAIILGRLCSEYQFWERGGKLQEGFFYATREHIYETTGLSEDQQRTAIKKLESCGILETKRIGVPSKTYYKIIPQGIQAEISRSGKTEDLVVGKPKDLYSEKSSQVIDKIIVNDNKIVSKDTKGPGLFRTPPKEVKKTLKSVIERFTNDISVQGKLFKYLEVLKQVRKSHISIIQFEEMLDILAELSIKENKQSGRWVDFKLMASIIDQSIKKGWNGFFAIDSNSTNRRTDFDTTSKDNKSGSLAKMSEAEKREWERSLKNEKF